MANRKKILLIFGVIYLIFASLMYFGLRVHLLKNFTDKGLNELISGKSISRDKTDDLCKYQVLGDPKEKGNYVKINIFCINGKKAVSTLSLSAIADKSVGGFLKEYARIIGFDENLYKEKNFLCYLDDKLLTVEMMTAVIRPTSTIDCRESIMK